LNDHPRSPSLARVERGSLCSGCGACALIAPKAIEMRMRKPGFLRPQQTAPLSERQEAALARACPGLGQQVIGGDRIDDPIWGPYLGMHTAYARDPELRFAASSGGALSAVLVHLLETGVVDGVVQTAAAETPPYANVTVVSLSAEQVQDAAGSRYAPSSPLAELGPHLESGRRLAFVGKPCDVAALRALAAEDPRVNRVFPVVLSFFCAGVPSQAGAEEVLASLGVRASDVTAFRFRGHGWPGRATAELADGGVRSMSYQDSWGAILSRHVQHRCKICADGTGAAADIVFADAWHCDERGYPVFSEEDGVSLVVVRTRAGARLIAEARDASRLELAPFDVEELTRMQPGQARRRHALLARLMALRLCGQPIPRYRGLHLFRAARRGRPGWVLRNFAGMVRRVISGAIES